MKVEDVKRCNFSYWYDTFSDVTIRSIILPIPQEFLDYLNADGIVLPEGSHQGAYSTSVQEDDDVGEEEVDWSEQDDSASASGMPDCQGFLHQIDSAIECLGGKVFPKLNWSAPQDAKWVSFNNSLMCTHASDVCLLLKSSDFITHDLTQSFLHCEDYEATSAEEHIKPELILRQWTDINTSNEFRCFVHRGNLVAISQRNHSKYFQHIVTSKNEIQTDIQNFFEEVIDGDFAAEDSSYVFDIWRTGKGRILLIDFNPCGPVTDPLLFDWREIEAMDFTQIEHGLIFRCIEAETGIRPNIHTPFGVPQDFIDLTTGEDPFKLKDLLQLGNSEQDSSSDDDDDDENKDAVQALEIER